MKDLNLDAVLERWREQSDNYRTQDVTSSDMVLALTKLDVIIIDMEARSECLIDERFIDSF